MIAATLTVKVPVSLWVHLLAKTRIFVILMLKKEEKNVDCIDPLPPKRVTSGQVVVESFASSQCYMQNFLWRLTATWSENMQHPK